MTKLSDLSTVDFLRWSLDHPGKIFIGGHETDSHGYKARHAKLKAAVLRSRVVHFDLDASNKIQELTRLPVPVLLYMAKAARMPWPHMLAEVTTTSGSTGLMLIEQLDVHGTSARSVCIQRMSEDDGDEYSMIVEPLSCEVHVGATRPSWNTAICQQLRPHLFDYIRDSFEDTTDPLFDRFMRMMRDRDPIVMYCMGAHILPNGELGVGDDWYHKVCEIDELAHMMAPANSQYYAIDWLRARPDLLHKALRLIIEEMMGAPQALFGIMALLANYHISTFSDTRPRGARMVGNRRTPYPAVTKVVIDLNVVHKWVRERTHEVGLGSHKRAHPVRGHWRLYRRGNWQTCDDVHAWVTGRDQNHQTCARTACKSFRTWIAEHERGDAALGHVHQTVEVIAPPKDEDDGFRKMNDQPEEPAP